MTIREFIEMFVDPEKQWFRVWSDNKDNSIFEGLMRDLPEDMKEMTINSIDNIDIESMIETKTITINVD